MLIPERKYTLLWFKEPGFNQRGRRYVYVTFLRETLPIVPGFSIPEKKIINIKFPAYDKSYYTLSSERCDGKIIGSQDMKVIGRELQEIFKII